uniref:Histone-lysine N-methyltransferase Set8 n=1 Tax=Glossina palpalis gambiensis TaxID=67801 RepID=A0A1B0B6P9_9MUSC
MVRRRASKTTSNQATNNSGNSNGVNNIAPATHLLQEDQNFASPKRKDSKIEENAISCNGIVSGRSKTKDSSSNKIKNERGSGAISNTFIGGSSATRSQTRPIENFFRPAKKQYNQNNSIDSTQESKLNIHPTLSASLSSSHHQLGSHSFENLMATSYCLYDLCEDTNDSEQTDLSDEPPALLEPPTMAFRTDSYATALDFSNHRASTRVDSHSSSHSSSNTSATENIFLQEPVLTLNVDKSPNQASSIKINKTLEVEPKFASPTSLATSVLNGCFNHIVTLDGTSSKLDSKYRPYGNGHEYALMMLPENDNSSCDSGVAFVTFSSSTSHENSNQNSPALTAINNSRRRKPATPHRILCPSPIKVGQRLVSPLSSPSTRKIVTGLSPRKSQRHLTTTTATGNAGTTAISNKISKTRRRLNGHKEEAPYTTSPYHHYQELKEEIDGDLDVILLDDLEEEKCEPVNSCKSIFGGTKCVSGNTQNPVGSMVNYAAIVDNKNKTASKSTKPTKTQTRIKYTVQKPAFRQQGAQSTAYNNGNREITECFPVRRSVRKTKTAVKEEMMRNLEQAILEERCDGLKIAYFEGKGRGVIAERRFQRGEFVIEYVGDLISTTEAAEREKLYALDESAGCYMYYFKHKNQQYCIDATEDTGKLGRLVNHSRNGNLMTKVVVVKQIPHLVLIAKDDIEAGEELCYDYGDRSKESLLHHPWLAF